MIGYTLRAIYNISQSDEDFITIAQEMPDSKVFEVTFGNTDARRMYDSVKDKPTLFSRKKFDGVYFIPTTYKKAVFMYRNRFNSLSEVFITTSKKVARMHSDYIISAKVDNDMGSDIVVDSIKFREFELIGPEEELETKVVPAYKLEEI